MKLLTVANTISIREVITLYERFIKPLDNPAYLTKHRQLPAQINLRPGWEDWDFPRIAAILELREWAPQYAHFTVDHALIISGKDDPEIQSIRAAHVDFAEYDLQTEAHDFHTLNQPRKNYGFIMANQVLEHVYNPYMCLQNVYNHLAPGGFFYLNVPVLNIPHFIPFQYTTGFAPIGLLTMFHALGFQILEVGQWGNLEYIQKLFQTHHWPGARQLTSTISEFRNAVSAWVLVRKP